MPGEHLAVNGGDLVRKGIDKGSMDRQERVKQVREPDSVRLGQQAEQCAVAVETPRPACLRDFKRRLPVAIKQLIAKTTGRVFERDFDRDSAKPFIPRAARNETFP